MMINPGKLLILVGLTVALAGLLLTFAGKIPLIGKLPGDLRIEREGFSFYFALRHLSVALPAAVADLLAVSSMSNGQLRVIPSAAVPLLAIWTDGFQPPIATWAASANMMQSPFISRSYQQNRRLP